MHSEQEVNQDLLLTRCLFLTADKFNNLTVTEQVKLSDIEKAKYGHLIYELALELQNTPDNNGNTPTTLELINMIDSCFSPLALKQANLGFEFFLLINAVKEKAKITIQQPSILLEHHAVNLDLYNENRERLKSITINRSKQIIREKNYLKIQNKITTDEKTKHLVLFPHILRAKVECEIAEIINRDLPSRVQLLLHQTGKKNCQHFHQRYFANIIALNTFMKLAAVILMQETKSGIYVISEPGVLYLLGGLIYGDIFSNIIKNTLWKDKAYYLSVTLISVVGAALAAPLTETEPNIWYRLLKALAVFSIVTGFHAIEILTPWHKKMFNQSWWFIDNYEYQIGGPVCPGRIFMASALPIIIRAVNNIFDKSGYNVADNDLKIFLTWVATGLITQILQTAYFQIKLPKYAKLCDKSQALPKWDFLQLYSYTKNYTVRSRQSENIWTTSAIIFLSEVAFNLISVYPDEFWLPIMLAPIVLFAGSRLGTFFQREIFTRMETPSSILKEESNLLYNMRFYLGLESSAITKLIKLNSRNTNHPQTLPQRIQQVEVTGQTGKQGVTFGERNLFASITTIALYYVFMHYLWDRSIVTFIDDNDNFKRGTWGFLGLHILLAIIVHTIIRLAQYAIMRFETTTYLGLEVTGIVTRAATFIKTAVTKSFSSAVESATNDVFIIDKSNPRKAMEQHAKQLKARESIIPITLDLLQPDVNLESGPVQTITRPDTAMTVEHGTPIPPIAPYAKLSHPARPMCSLYQLFNHVAVEHGPDGSETFVPVDTYTP